eukprot:c9716_g1_i2.p1 GENE.c9716_g1_i2~~c9716_g1_i2.p1  ORF type:complete len:235 (-),score=41.54 c9716_g1_i2:584-1288(-)
MGAPNTRSFVDCGMDGHHHHRSALKKPNKANKSGKHKSSRQATTDKKNRVDAHGGVIGQNRPALNTRRERVNQSKQRIKHKREAAVRTLRNSLGHVAPRIVTIVPLFAAANPQALLKHLLLAGGVAESSLVEGNQIGGASNEGSVINIASSQVTAVLPQLKSRLTFLTAKFEVFSVLEALKVAGIVVVLLPPTEEPLCEQGMRLLSVMRAQVQNYYSHYDYPHNRHFGDIPNIR